MGRIWTVLTRRKVIHGKDTDDGGGGDGDKGGTGLARVLNTFDLTALGVGSTLGVGVYVLAGHVAKETAGPAVVLSFLIAAVASVFAGLCYAEFGARAPRAGSAYIYSYVCVGEFIAFVIGWNLILEYVIGSASVARGLTLYLDTLINDTLKDTFTDIAPINLDHMSSYFDFCSFGISILLAAGLAFGVKESTLVNNMFTVLNILVVVFVIIAGAIYANTDNWSIPADKTNANIGDGGFFPFGIEGMIKGAATCFYGFIGFDCIATTGEEVRNPKRAIPISIISSLTIIFLAYFGISTVVTLMVPYYEQDINAPIPYAFEAIDWQVAKWIVAIGGIFGLCASLFGAMFPLPRIIYAMASDGLIFRFLGMVNERFSTPVIGTLLAGLLTGIMAAMFELKQLVNMMSIGTLLAYTIVAACVLLLRYSTDFEEFVLIRRYASCSSTDEDYDDDKRFFYRQDDGGFSSIEGEDWQPIMDDNTDRLTIGGYVQQTIGCGKTKVPTKLSENTVAVNVCLYCLLCLLLGLCIMYMKEELAAYEIWAICFLAVIVALMLLLLLSILIQPVSQKQLSFKVPLVPLIPALSILVNIYLMLMLDANTWIRFGVWMGIGLIIYLLCVLRHKSEPVVKTKLAIRSIVGTPVHLTSTPKSLDDLEYDYASNNSTYVNEAMEDEDEDDDSGIITYDDQMSHQSRSDTLTPKIPLNKPSGLSLNTLTVLNNFDNMLSGEFTTPTSRRSSLELDNYVTKEQVVAQVHAIEPVSPITNESTRLESPRPQATNGICIARKSDEMKLTDAQLIFGSHLTYVTRSNETDDSTYEVQPVAKTPTKSNLRQVSQFEPNQTLEDLKDDEYLQGQDDSVIQEHSEISLPYPMEAKDVEIVSVPTILVAPPLPPPSPSSPVYTEPTLHEHVFALSPPPAPPPPPPLPSPDRQLSITPQSTVRLPDNLLQQIRNSKTPSESTLQTKINKQPRPPAPPPPPMSTIELPTNQKAVLSRVPSFKTGPVRLPENIIQQIKDNKLKLKKPAPKPPVENFPRKDSQYDDLTLVKEVDDNVKFGSAQHKKIIKKLTEKVANDVNIRKSQPTPKNSDLNVMTNVKFTISPENVVSPADNNTEEDVNMETLKAKISDILLTKSSTLGPRIKPKPTFEPVNSDQDAPVTKVAANTLTALDRRMVSDLRKTFTTDETTTF